MHAGLVMMCALRTKYITYLHTNTPTLTHGGNATYTGCAWSNDEMTNRVAIAKKASDCGRSGSQPHYKLSESVSFSYNHGNMLIWVWGCVHALGRRLAVGQRIHVSSQFQCFWYGHASYITRYEILTLSPYLTHTHTFVVAQFWRQICVRLCDCTSPALFEFPSCPGVCCSCWMRPGSAVMVRVSLRISGQKNTCMMKPSLHCQPDCYCLSCYS